MSWEESPPIVRPCPCGIGHYTIIERTDDWGRSEERWEMQCQSCVENYGLFSFDYNRKGIVSTSRNWIPRQLSNELATMESTIEREKENLSAFAMTEFLERWKQHFKGKTKKAIWRELTQDGARYPSLPTFYLHIRESNLEQQLARYFDYREIATVIRILQLNHPEIDRQVELIQTLERVLEAKKNHAREFRSAPIANGQSRFSTPNDNSVDSLTRVEHGSAKNHRNQTNDKDQRKALEALAKSNACKQEEAELARLNEFFNSLGFPNWKPIDPHFSMSHFEYLESPLWRKIRRRVIKRDGGVCALCPAKATEVHHHSYEYEVIIGQNDRDLIALCSACHKSVEFTPEGTHRTVEEKWQYFSNLKRC